VATSRGGQAKLVNAHSKGSPPRSGGIDSHRPQANWHDRRIRAQLAAAAPLRQGRKTPIQPNADPISSKERTSTSALRIIMDITLADS
jgi:hypothetical protein